MSDFLVALADEMALTFWRMPRASAPDSAMLLQASVTQDGRCLICTDGVVDVAQDALLQKILTAIHQASCSPKPITLAEMQCCPYVLVFGAPCALVEAMGQALPYASNTSNVVGKTTFVCLSALDAMLHDAMLKKACWYILKRTFLPDYHA